VTNNNKTHYIHKKTIVEGTCHHVLSNVKNIIVYIASKINLMERCSIKKDGVLLVWILVIVIHVLGIKYLKSILIFTYILVGKLLM
jgi:hypothetical protein